MYPRDLCESLSLITFIFFAPQALPLFTFSSILQEKFVVAIMNSFALNYLQYNCNGICVYDPVYEIY